MRIHVCNEQYGCKEGDFRLNTTGSYRIALFYLDKQYIGLRLGDLQYLSRMFHVLQKQLKVYTLSLSARRLGIFDCGIHLIISNKLITPVST